MSVTAIVRKEYRELRRSYTLLATGLLFTLTAVFFASIRWVPKLGLREGTPTSTLALLNSLTQPGTVFIPILGLLAGYQAIAGPRERGSIKMALSLPNTRREVVFGKFVGRFSVVATATLTASVAVWLVAVSTYADFDTTAFLLTAVLTAIHGGVFVAISVGFSAWMRSRLRALVGTAFLSLLFLALWDTVLLALQLLFIGPSLPAGSQLPNWMQVINVLNPVTAFQYARQAVVPAFSELTRTPESSAVYLQDWIGFPVLLAWILIPLVLGSLRFERADIS
ncbi:ABC-2 type transporter [Halovivax asiaticus JCM 14624]|uniref:ABC-2 type transporter n=1 Tax=Halovivax asiaticus JCM 14624 TaxID=1227490 RepID=M0BSC5_9EURY|nr:ABC transporter permease subunit [Halovivax asiaticus]ELZ13911.1 ABC-2 type transporter [Halovivax asiaticus JCM 14624]